MESSRIIEQLSQFGQKVPQAAIAKLLTLLLVIYAAYLVAVTGWKFVDTPANHGNITATSNAESGQPQQQQSNVNVSSITKLNLFGKPAVKKPEPIKKPEPVVSSVAPKTRLNLTLTGIVADNSSKVSDTSVAIIESRNGQETYGIGQQISGTSAKVNQILLDRVILSVGTGFETLMLDGIEYSTTIPGSATELKDNIDVDSIISKQPTRPARPQNDVKPAAKRPARVDNRENYELAESLRERREELFSDPEKLLDVIRISPHRDRETGDLLGYKLAPGKDPAMFKEAGLRHNDLAVEINGYDLTDMQQALSLMSELKELTEANITVIRDGSPVQILLAL